jgi:hypothetical protein
MIFTPFAFMAPTGAAPAFTPANITGIQEWWNSSAGVLLDGSSVDQWTGQINSTILATNTIGSGLLYNASDSNVNNKPSLANDGSTYASLRNTTVLSDFTPTQNRSQFYIFRANTGNSGYSMLGGQTSTAGNASEISAYISAPSNNDKLGAYFFNGGSQPSTLSVANKTYCFIITYSNTGTAEYYIIDEDGTTSTFTKTGLNANDINPFTLEIGGYNNSFLYNGLITEFGFVNGIMSTSDIADLQQYMLDTYTTPSTPLLDDYPGATGAYSLRKLSSTYTGAAIQVRRSTDNATQDIGFVGEGLDITAMETFVGGAGNNGFVSIWYDQSGNGNDQAQATAGDQPQIVSGGSTITQGGLPTLEFNTAYFRRSNIISNTADKTTFNVYYPTAISAGKCIMDLSSVSATGQSWVLSSETALRCVSRTYVTTAGAINTYSLLEMWQDGITIDNANQFKMYLNGTYVPRASGTAGTLTTGTSDFTIGWSNNGSNHFDGSQQEVVIYPSALSDVNREGVRDNINTYYSVY